MDSNEEIIFQTLLYFDIFNYPLTKEELWQFAKLDLKQNESDFYKSLQKIKIPFYKSFYFLKGRKEIINQRIKKEAINKLKLKKANKIINILKLIPTVNLIGISGSLSMQNSDLDDDIDIFVICQSGLVWISRLFLVFTLSFLQVYRNKNDKDYKDKICLNLLIAENNMKFFSKKKNLYLAHEIVQLFPIFQRDNTYAHFIKENEWVKFYLPNYLERTVKYKIAFSAKKTILDKFLIRFLLISRIETIAKYLQWNYMKNNVTNEIIFDDVLAFHPINYEKQTINKLNIQFKKYFKNIP